MDKVFSNPDVYRVRVPFVNLGQGETNCYIVRDGSSCLVVDPGAASPEGLGRVREALAALGIEPRECEVLLTHTHFDHAEAARLLFPAGVRMHVSRLGYEERRPALAQAIRGRFAERMVKMGATPADAEAYSYDDFETAELPDGAFDYRFIGQGDAVRVGRFEFEVVETPGHTMDHVCLLGRAGAPAFTGDEVLEGTTPGVDAPYGDADALSLYIEGLAGSWTRDVACALPGHGEAMPGDVFRACAAETAERKLRHCERIAACVRENPGICGVELGRRALTRKSSEAWAASTSMSRYYTLLEVLVSVRYLENQGALRREEENGVWGFYPG